MNKHVMLSQALSAKLCHDLAGAIGTIDNCITLIDNENKSIGQKAKALVELESKNLVKKVKFFRCAYGMSGEEEQLSMIFLTKLLKDFFLCSEVVLEFKFEPGMIFLEAEIIKATMCLVEVACDIISSRGTVEIYIGSKTDKCNIIVKAIGKVVKSKEENLSILIGEIKGENKIGKIDFNNCREHYISNLLEQEGYKMCINKFSNYIEYDVLKK